MSVRQDAKPIFHRTSEAMLNAIEGVGGSACALSLAIIGLHWVGVYGGRPLFDARYEIALQLNREDIPEHIKEKLRAIVSYWEADWDARIAQMLENPHEELVGPFSNAKWRALCAHYADVCLACTRKRPLSIDHINPTSKGGSNDMRNLQPLCQSCNSKKGTQVIDYRSDAAKFGDPE